MFCVIDSLESRRFMSATVSASVTSGDSTLVKADLSAITIDKNNLASHTKAFDKLLAADKQAYDAAVAAAKTKATAAYTKVVQSSTTTINTVKTKLAAVKAKFSDMLIEDKAKLQSVVGSLLSAAKQKLSDDTAAQASATVSLNVQLQGAQAAIDKAKAVLSKAVSSDSVVAKTLAKYKADLTARTTTLAADLKQLAADTKKLKDDQLSDS